MLTAVVIFLVAIFVIAFCVGGLWLWIASMKNWN